MVDMNVVREWAKKNYPSIIANDDAIVKLYKSRVLKENVVNKVRYSAPYKEIASLEEKVPAMIEVVLIAEERRSVKEVCKECGRTVCNNPNHTEREEKIALSYSVADSTGIISLFFFDRAQVLEKLKESENFIVFGYKETKGTFGSSFYVKDFIPIDSAGVEAFQSLVDFMAIHLKGGNVSKAEYDNFISANNGKSVKLKEMEKFLILKDDGTNIIPNM